MKMKHEKNVNTFTYDEFYFPLKFCKSLFGDDDENLYIEDDEIDDSNVEIVNIDTDDK